MGVDRRHLVRPVKIFDKKFLSDLLRGIALEVPRIGGITDIHIDILLLQMELDLLDHARILLLGEKRSAGIHPKDVSPLVAALILGTK
jgi:hypothetical protein